MPSIARPIPTRCSGTGGVIATLHCWRTHPEHELLLAGACHFRRRSTRLTGSQDDDRSGVVTSNAAVVLSSNATWSGGVVPTNTDDVTIVSGATVTIDTAAVALDVTVNSGGTLLWDTTTARTLTTGLSVTVANVKIAWGDWTASPTSFRWAATNEQRASSTFSTNGVAEGGGAGITLLP